MDFGKNKLPNCRPRRCRYQNYGQDRFGFNRWNSTAAGSTRDFSPAWTRPRAPVFRQQKFNSHSKIHPVYRVPRNPRSPPLEANQLAKSTKSSESGYWAVPVHQSATVVPNGMSMEPAPELSSESVDIALANTEQCTANTTTNATNVGSTNLQELPPSFVHLFNYPPPVQSMWNISAGPGYVPVFSSPPPPPVQPLWTEYFAPDNGRPYYYNSELHVSFWEKPPGFENFVHAAGTGQGDPQLNPNVAITDQTSKPVMSNNEKIPSPETSIDVQTPKPTASKSIPNSIWWIIGTNDCRIFFYNTFTKVSIWDIPLELKDRADVHQMMADLKQDIQTGTSKLEGSKEVDANLTEISKEGKANDNVDASNHCTSTKVDDARKVKSSKKQKESVQDEEKSDSVQEAKLASEVTAEISTETVDNAENPQSLEDMDTLKGVDVVVAERLAAKQRVLLPLETRKKTFLQLLIDKNVSAFSTWEKELQKIVFDPRYLLLTSKERKAEFETYVQNRATEEAEASKLSLKQAKEEFAEFVSSVLETYENMNFTDFERKYANYPQMHLLEKYMDRKIIFMEVEAKMFQQSMSIQESKTGSTRKKKKKDKRSSSKRKRLLDLPEIESEFRQFLREKLHDHKCSWKAFYEDYNLSTDPLFSRIPLNVMKTYFTCRQLAIEDDQVVQNQQINSPTRDLPSIKSSNSQQSVNGNGAGGDVCNDDDDEPEPGEISPDSE